MSICKGLLAVLLMVLTSATFGAEPRTVDVPAGPAKRAVRQLVRQIGWGVLSVPGSLDGFEARSVRGTYEPIEALRLLLNGSGLNFVLTAPHFIFVYPAPLRQTINRRRRSSERDATHSCICVSIPRAAWCWEGDLLEYQPSCGRHSEE